MVAGIIMCRDGIITVSRCPASNACLQYSIGHSYLNVAPSNVPPQFQVSSGSWQVPPPPHSVAIAAAAARDARQLTCASCDAPKCLKQHERSVFLAHALLAVCESPPRRVLRVQGM